MSDECANAFPIVKNDGVLAEYSGTIPGADDGRIYRIGGWETDNISPSSRLENCCGDVMLGLISIQFRISGRASIAFVWS